MMDVVAPEMRDPTLSAGAFVLLSIDPVASVADMQDAKATAAAAQLLQGRVLAMIRRYDIDSMQPFHTQPLAFDFLCVGHGLPENPPYACVGLSPGAAHPAARPPVSPSIPLPWSDCYLHLFEECGSVITRIHKGATGSISRIPEDELLRVITAKFDDHAKYGLEVGSDTEYSYTSDDSFEAQSAVVMPVSDEGDASIEPSNAAGTSQTDSSPGDSPKSTPESLPCISSPHYFATVARGPGSNDEACFQPELSPNPDDRNIRSPSRTSSGSSSLGDIPKLRFRGEVWLDLTTVDDFDPPEYMFCLIDSLQEIEREWANRMALKLLADQPLTAQWVAEVAAIGVGDAMEETEVGGVPEAEDVLPENDIAEKWAGDTL
ncbi:hypothetical protein AURDEDRAFT_167698 [Auricularia subglabra TFB-10046 SS5]|nr:hypothetical protein AURDEDRAFT_167698 [Auricularia subglabra TFB-10046 SS5]